MFVHRFAGHLLCSIDRSEVCSVCSDQQLVVHHLFTFVIDARREADVQVGTVPWPFVLVRDTLRIGRQALLVI